MKTEKTKSGCSENQREYCRRSGHDCRYCLRNPANANHICYGEGERDPIDEAAGNHDE